ncbi:TPA: HipA N-terminal domain-containing protein [Legionella pneumophila]|uniref:Toxin HipA n=1 Tax=Legionella pneumophila TaxID=446 RepID=A0AAN5PZX1_LEGPN|nr:HipA N-terminal domain-containing protein [Legionella pneumophila]TIH05336.1 toxin HipA [Legionella pneumophila]VEB31310.1 HipA protein [Legionella pneumophila]BCZ98091.1 toxin HipA [Legionella pneumophila]HAT1942735.1 toxin HipA [Legionella pneumophila]HAT3856439.1 toxin HipA [Legionella pneumophila]
MRKACVSVDGIKAGTLEELQGGTYQFTYFEDYHGAPVSLTMPLKNKVYEFDVFPPFFEGLLPEGIMLEALLRKYKIDKNDYFGQLILVGQDVVGAVTIEELR